VEEASERTIRGAAGGVNVVERDRAAQLTREGVNVRRIGVLALLGLLGTLPCAARAGSLLPDRDLSIERSVVLLDGGDAGADDVWNPAAVRQEMEERLLSLLPGGVFEDVARTFVDRTLQLDLSPSRAFLRLRLPL
jgi:hypothetical protein